MNQTWLIGVAVAAACASPHRALEARTGRVIIAPAVATQPIAQTTTVTRELTPPAGRIVKRPTLAAMQKRRWFGFGGTWFRLWGGANTGSQPKGVSVAPDGGAVYVTNFGYHDKKNVWRYDAATLAVTARAAFPGNAIESVVSPDGALVYVSNFFHREVLALDALSLAVTRRYAVQNVPKHFALSPDGTTMWVSNWESGTTTVIDVGSGAVRAHVKVGKEPRGTAITHDGKKVYVANFGSKTVSVIDADTLAVIKTVKACRAPRHLAITADDTQVLVTCYGGHDVLVLDAATDTIARKVRVGRGPKTIELSRDGRFAYTADYKGSTLSIIDLATWSVRVVPVPTVKTSGLAVSPDDRRIYVTGWDSTNLLVFERRMPGDPADAPLGPRAPGKACHRKTKAECARFP